MSERTIAVVTGTRAEFGLLRSPMEHIQSHDDLSLQVVATGMHLAPQYGNTYKEIEREGFTIDRKVDMLLDSDTGLGMAKSLGIGISGLAEAFRHLDPDIVVVLGDRDEPFAAGVAAAHMQIPVAHIHGGDVMIGATIDDSIRYALTKFAHIHFPASKESAKRVENLGEEPWRITISGAPGLDDILNGDYTSASETCKELELDQQKNIALIVQHSVTTQPEKAGQQMQATLDAISELDLQPVVIYPNSDAGGKNMIDKIENHPDRKQFMTFKNLSREKYLGLMEAADVMVGNSSSGIIEAPSFNLPVVDIGSRQARRQRADNTISVPHDRDAIKNAVHRCLTNDKILQRACTSKNPYDYGGAGRKIADRLAQITINDELIQKNITF